MAKDHDKSVALHCVLQGIGSERFSTETAVLCREVLPQWGAEGLYGRLCAGLPFEPEMTVTSVNVGNCIDVTLHHNKETQFYVFFRVNIVGSNECFLKNIYCEPIRCGTGAKFLSSFMDTMQSLGIQDIRIEVAEDVGLSFWPKVGFAINQKSWHSRYEGALIQHIHKVADEHPQVDAIRENLLKLVAEKGERSLCYIANMSHPQIEGHDFAQFFLSPRANQNAFKWHDATLHLSNKDQMDFMENFLEKKRASLSKRRKPAHAQTHRSLKPIFG